MLTNSISENERIRQRVTDIYAKFVQQVDPKGYVMDYLIQKRIITHEDTQLVLGKESKQDRCRAMLNELHERGKPTAYVELREALMQHYHFIVDMIDEGTTGRLTTGRIYRPNAQWSKFLSLMLKGL